MKIKFFSLVILSLLMGAINKISAQSMRIENERYVNSTTYRFDVYIYGTTGSFELATLTGNVAINTNWPLGTISASVVSGTCELSNPAQVPPSVTTNVPGLVRVTSATPPGTGNGSIVTTAGSRVATVQVVCASGFATSEMPNLRWNFTTPTASLNAYISNVNTQIIGNSNATAIANQVNAYNPIYWNGTAWSGFVFTGTANAAGTAVSAPTASLDATVLANLTASGDITCRSLNLQSGNTFNMQSNTLNLGNKFNTNGATLTLSNASLVLTGNTPATQNQTLSIGDVTVNNLTFQGSGTKLINDTLRVSGTVAQGGSAVFNANGRLVLVSNSTSTARISAIAANSITGNLKIEQYFPAGKRGFRFVANPLSIPLPASQIRDDIFITGSGTGTTTLGAENSNGFDYTPAGNPSAFTYNTLAGNSTQTVDPGWTALSNGNTSTVPVGSALRVLVRGDRSTTGVLDGSITTANEVNMDFYGPINDGNTPSITLSKSANSPFNFIGNPLNSNINSNALNSTATLSAGIWVWNQALGTKGAYTTGLRADNFIIPARSGFFLRIDDAVAAGSNVGTLSFPEASKTATAATYQAFKGPNDKIVLNIHSTGVRWDELRISFDERYKSGTDFEDIDKFMNPDVSVFSINTDGKKLAIDQRPFDSQTIPLGFYTPGTLDFTFDFTGTVMPTDLECFLKDGSILTPINGNTKYSTKVDGMATANTTRFAIVVQKKANGLTESLLANAFTLYPNPVMGAESVHILPKRIQAIQGTVQYSIIDMTGKQIQTGSYQFDGQSALVIPTAELAAGVYHVQILHQDQIANLSFVKQ